MASDQADLVTDGDVPQTDGSTGDTDALIQPCGFLLELSPDWLILRASENSHKFLRAYHAKLAGEPLTNFTLAQPLHDLRNSLSRQRSSSGIARAYRARLIDDPRYFDFAFQVVDGRILLEGIPHPDLGFGAAYGSVSRLLDGIVGSDGASIAEAAARRMRALTGFDRVEVRLAGHGVEATAQSTRGQLDAIDLEPIDLRHALIVPDTSVRPVPLFPRNADDATPGRALLRSPPAEVLEKYAEQGVRSMLIVPVASDEETIGTFICTHGSPGEANFEMQAAAELFAQVLAIRLQLRNGTRR